MYHLPCVCHTLVPKIHVRPEILLVFQYIDMLKCVVKSIHDSTEQQLELLMINEDR